MIMGYSQKRGLKQTWLENHFEKGAIPNSGPVPDYANIYYWAASPYKHDTSDSIPDFLSREKKEEKADMFYIHPTTYLGSKIELNTTSIERKEWLKILGNLQVLPWNANLDDETLNHQTDIRPILYQASVFNGSCRVFAPRYRQANIKAFFVPESQDAQQAFDLAYSDIRKAFEYYLQHENKGRPIVIASHSQGSLHAIRLLQEFFDGKPLHKQLVCAYIIGRQVPRTAFKNIPIGSNSTSTGCFVTWRTFLKNEIPATIKQEKGDSQCVNPLTWKTDTGWTPDSLNIGALFDFKEALPHFSGAEIEPTSKILWVMVPKNGKEKYKKLKNYHVFDYNFFWMNIRENVKERIDAYMKASENFHAMK
jgi:hypothetical protein